MSNVCNTERLALGGGCHWCTEAVFESLIGVEEVKQGYVASYGKNSSLSEAIVLTYNPSKIELSILIEIHLLTHKSTSLHSMRDKYRSAIYVFSKEQKIEVMHILTVLQSNISEQIITQVLPFKAFKASRAELQNYYYKDPEKPFCKTYIDPKLKLLLKRFTSYVKSS